MRFYTYIASLLFVLSVLGQVSGLNNSYMAGNPVSFHYETAEQDVQLLVLHSYGTQIVNGKSEDDGLRFTLPELIIQKKGKVVLQLIAEEEVVWKQRIHILARKDGKTTMEAYCGPKHLVVKITRAKFEQLADDLVQRTLGPCEAALFWSGLLAAPGAVFLAQNWGGR